MDAERLEQIENLYHAALEREESLRPGFLRDACGEDGALRREVESLLAFGESAEGFIEVPAMEMAARTLTMDEDKPGHWLPARIGRYQILRMVGEGGMGVVYEAEQEHPSRIVALKVIKPGLANPELLRRFEQESQALGRLQHPGIAQIHEAGTADTGFGLQPYFAMEFIRGRSLLEHAEAQHLNTQQRLELMVKICDAVHHAHQRGLIHRDLKPGNILVDETGQPKILDFGVARVTDSDVLTTRQTDVGQIVGTLAYMSPEQVLGDPLELDTRSDVYALGVILYELLSGRKPYSSSQKLHEAVQTIREEDPALLGSVSRTYRGDIETIAGKALEKDKERRYASAAGLAADIKRYLNDEPITARPPSTRYQLQKFARRHKALVAGVTVVFLVLVAGTVVSTWEATRARRANEVAQAVNDFLQHDLLAQASASVQAGPGTKADPDLKVRTALERAAKRIEGKFKGQPLVEASIRQTIGKTYEDLGMYPEAQVQIERALDLRRRVLGEQHSDTLESMSLLAELCSDRGKYGQAEQLFSRVLEVVRHLRGGDHPDTLSAMNNLAVAYAREGKYAQAEPLDIKVLETRRRVLGEGHQDTVESMNNLAVLYQREGKYEPAEALQIKVLEIFRRTMGEEHPHTLDSMYSLAVVYRYEGKYERAEQLFTRILEVQRRILGDAHPDTLDTMNELAVVYREEAKDEQAEALFTNVLEGRRHALGDQHTVTLATMNSLALLYQTQGKYERAEALFTKILDIRHRTLGDENPSTLLSMYNLAYLHRVRGRYGQAEALLTKTLETQRRVLGEQHPDTLASVNDLAVVYGDQGRFGQAEALLTKTMETQRRVLNPDHPDIQMTMNSLANLYSEQAKYEQAEQLYTEVLEIRQRVLRPQHPAIMGVLASLGWIRLQQQRYPEAEALLREALISQTSDTWYRYSTQSLLGASLATQKRYGEAESLLLPGYEGMLRLQATIPADSRVKVDQVAKWIARLYADWGKPVKAALWVQKHQQSNVIASPDKR